MYCQTYNELINWHFIDILVPLNNFCIFLTSSVCFFFNYYVVFLFSFLHFYFFLQFLMQFLVFFFYFHKGYSSLVYHSNTSTPRSFFLPHLPFLFFPNFSIHSKAVYHRTTPHTQVLFFVEKAHFMTEQQAGLNDTSFILIRLIRYIFSYTENKGDWYTVLLFRIT